MKIALLLLSFFAFFCIASADKMKGFVELPTGVKVHPDKRIVAIPIEVINDKGGLEFIVSHGKAKDYESIFTTKVTGRMLHLALKTAELEPSSFTDEGKYEDKIKEQRKKGSRLEIWVEFGDNIQPIEDFVQWNDKKLKSPVFFFAGSFFQEWDKRKVYAAEMSLNLVAAIPALDMVVGPAFDVDSPYFRNAKKFFVPVPESLPKIGTKGVLFLKPIEKKS